MSDLSPSTYLREVTLRKPKFQQALRNFQRQIPPDFDWYMPPRTGGRHTREEWEEQKRRIGVELVEFLKRWPFISVDDLTGDPTRPKVFAVFEHPTPPGFILLQVHLSATGDEVKRTFQRIKRELAPLFVGTLRQRSGTFRDRLAVWDLVVEKGCTFPQVARKLRKKVSTVKGLYWAARRDILGIGSKAKSSRADRQRAQLVKVDLSDTDRHFRDCPECSKAKTPEEFCASMRAYVVQDVRSPRERLPITKEPESSQDSSSY